MRIVADENIPLLESFFGDLGEIRRVAGRQMRREHLQDADVLLVRSVTRVNRELLEGTPVRFVGTATIGTDHIDLDWLKASGVAFASAPGCNANSVAEYVICAISLYLERSRRSWQDISVGIVGCGNVGSRLRQRLAGLGCQVKASDPPRAAAGESGLVSLEEVLACDVVSMHTPLTRSGDFPTWHLLDADRLAGLNASQLLINCGRGAAIDNAALKARLDQPDAPLVVLDVWEPEPNIDVDLLDRVWFGTPHIAGYSLDGKVNGTEMIYRALCQHLGLPLMRRAEQYLPEPPLSLMAFTASARLDEALNTAIRACYDIRHDDSLFRDMATLPDAERPAYFDQLRRHYRVRREFGSVKICLKSAAREMERVFTVLGFSVKR